MNRQQRMLNRLTASRLALLVEPRRAGGGVICQRCSRTYSAHPLGGPRGYDGEMFLNRLCDGRLVKL